MIKALIKSWSLFEQDTKRRFGYLFILMVIGSIAEAAGIGAVFPLLETMFLKDGEAPSAVTAYALNMAAQFYPNNPFAALALIVFAIITMKNLFLVYMIKYQLDFAWKTRAYLSGRLFEHYIHNPYAFHIERNSASLLRNVTTGVAEVLLRLVMPAITLVTEILVVSAITILLAFMAPYETLVALLALGTLGGVFYLFVRRPLLTWAVQSFATSERYIFWVNQGLGGIKETKAMGSEAFFSNYFKQSVIDHSTFQRRISLVNQLPRHVLEVVLVGGILLGIVFMLPDGDSATGLLPVIGMFSMAVFRLLPSFNRITGASGVTRSGIPAVEHIYDDVQEARRYQSKVSSSKPTRLVFDKQITFDDVSFKYAESDLTALEGINLTIKRGQSVGIVGASGAGKTTLVDVLLGLFPTTTGVLSVDGTPIASVLDQWRAIIGYIPQDIFLIDDTLRRNIAFALADEKIDAEAVGRAVDQARLTDFIATLPDGLDTLVGERGVRLSGGQKQRIGIARALYRHASVLIMDEATSSLDPNTEMEISSAVASLLSERTVIIIAHRLSTVKQCDIIYVMEDGQIIDSGTFNDLAENNAKFRQMIELMSVTIDG